MMMKELEDEIRTNILILSMESFYYEKTRDDFYAISIADRNDYLTDLCSAHWNVINKRCFVDSPDVRSRTAGLMVLIGLMLAYDYTWGEIYVDSVVEGVMAGDGMEQIGVLHSIMLEFNMGDEQLDPIMLKMLGELAQSKNKTVANDATEFILSNGISVPNKNRSLLN